MNGIDAVAIATGQDWRAIESGIHAYHASKLPSNNNYNASNHFFKDNQHNHSPYSPLTNYEMKKINEIEYFMGYIEIPIAVGTRGGALHSNPAYRNNLAILGNPNAATLAEILTTVGIAQNFAALRALAIEGIQKGHMTLHAKNIAVSVGIPYDHVNEAVEYMKQKNAINQDTAKEFLNY